MKKVFVATALVVGIAAATIALQSAGSSTLNSYTKTLSNAQGVSARMNSVTIGGGRERYSIDLAKPGMARIETPTMMLISNGTEIVTVMKQQKMYARTPFAPVALDKAMMSDEFLLFRPFFKADALSGMSMVKELEPVSRRGEQLNVVQGIVDTSAGKIVKLMVGADNLVRQAEFSTTKGAASVLDFESFTLAAPPASRFEFKAPEGFKEVNLAEMTATRWYDNIEEAKAVAKATNRIVLIDFMFEGCVWCAKLDADVFSTSEFKSKAQGFVLAKVDILKDPSQAEPYGVAGAPDIRFIKPDGTEVGRISGYVPLPQFLQKMDAALSGR